MRTSRVTRCRPAARRGGSMPLEVMSKGRDDDASAMRSRDALSSPPVSASAPSRSTCASSSSASRKSAPAASDGLRLAEQRTDGRGQSGTPSRRHASRAFRRGPRRAARAARDWCARVRRADCRGTSAPLRPLPRPTPARPVSTMAPLRPGAATRNRRPRRRSLGSTSQRKRRSARDLAAATSSALSLTSTMRWRRSGAPAPSASKRSAAASSPRERQRAKGERGPRRSAAQIGRSYSSIELNCKRGSQRRQSSPPRSRSSSMRPRDCWRRICAAERRGPRSPSAR